EERGFLCQTEVVGNLYINVDPLRLTECFEELLKNSGRWCSCEPKRLHIIAHLALSEYPATLDRSTQYVEMHFADNGPGVSTTLKSMIFEQFVSTNEQGTGLGLAYVK